jgi:hypothetical protein
VDRHGWTPEIILYLTSQDSELLRKWLNRESSVAWIIKAGQSGCEYRWQAVDALDTLPAGHHCLWHKEAGPLNIPSGSPDVPDAIVEDPYAGWSQRLDHENAHTPWFGANLPGPYSFRFKPDGREAPDAIGRSGFNWLGDGYRVIGKPASLRAAQWWNRLGRYVRSQSTGIPWPSPEKNARMRAYAFPDAYAEMLRGRPHDVNP